MAHDRTKIWVVFPDSHNGFMISPDGPTMVGDKSNFISASKQGLAFSGKSISMGTTSENIRQGGLFINMNDFVRMIPPTMATPIPSQIPFPPLGFMIQVLVDVPFFMAMLAGC